MHELPAADGVVGFRRWTVQDAPWYVAATRDQQMRRFTTDPPELTAAAVAEAITELPAAADRESFLVIDAHSGTRLGNVALRHEHGIGEVSYWIAPEARGRGAGSRALGLFATWALTRLGLRELRLWTHADNLASRTVAERAGFRRDPGRDQVRVVREGDRWPTVGYRMGTLEESRGTSESPAAQRSPMASEPTVTNRADQPYLAIRGRVSMQNIGAVADRFPELFGWLGARGLEPAGAPFLKYNLVNMDGLLEIEAGVPTLAMVDEAGTAAAQDAVFAAVLPGGRYAVHTHHGHPEGLAGATADLLNWAAERGMEWDLGHDEHGERWGARLEVYRTNPREQSDPNNWETDLVFRLAD